MNRRPARLLVLLLGLAALASTSRAQTYTVIGWNDLGMHCMDSDYGVFSILPPFNTIHAHVIDSQGVLVLDPTALAVSYEAVADPGGSFNSFSSGKTGFWDHVQVLYGVSLPPEMGLAGYAMPGPSNEPQVMAFDPDFAWFSGEGIPITPTDDTFVQNTYPMLRVAVRDGGGALLASTDIVLPVSDEMDCRACHGSGSDPAARPRDGWVFDSDPDRDYRLNALRLHDDYQLGLPLYTTALETSGYNAGGLYRTVTDDGKPILCARCHLSNALPGTGMPGIPALTHAVHGLHAWVRDPGTGQTLEDATNRDACYLCHPGSTTRCLRGAMGAALLPGGEQAMQCQSCHGSMSTVGDAAREGWLDQPSCQGCHTGTALRNNGLLRYLTVFEPTGERRVAADATFATNLDTPAPGLSLYRFSTGHGTLQCEACHGSTHAEYPSSHASDNLQSAALQGHDGMLVECQACHAADPLSPDRGPHGLHSLSQWWVDSHGDWVDQFGTRACKACHGIDLAGTVLSRTQAPRVWQVEGSPQTLPRGFVVGCMTCHEVEWEPDDVLRAPYRTPLAGVFPLPGYDLLPPAPPYVDPQAQLLGDGVLYYYQVTSKPVIRMVKSGASVAVYW